LGHPFGLGYVQAMYRIYFDSNDGGAGGGYLLSLRRSREDLAKIPGGPKEGMLVTIYMIGEIEMEATLEWDGRCDAWTAHPVRGTIRENTGAWD
jgi:hypothetical protein